MKSTNEKQMMRLHKSLNGEKTIQKPREAGALKRSRRGKEKEQGRCDTEKDNAVIEKDNDHERGGKRDKP